MFFASDDMTMSWSAIGHPFYTGNNINGVNCDTNANHIVEECYTLIDTMAGQQITAYQDSYIRKIVDTLNDIDGIIWEPANEVPLIWTSYDADYRAWVYHVSDVIMAYERTGGRKIHPIYLSPFPDRLANMESSGKGQIIGAWCDTVSYITNPPANNTGKVLLYDSDHSFDGATWNCRPEDQAWPWRLFTRGVHVFNLDGKQENATIRSQVKTSMGQVLSYAKKMHLAGMVPVSDTTIISTGYGLTEDCKEYLMFQPSAATDSIDLKRCGGDMSFNIEYLNVSTGAITAGTTVAGGASRNFTSNGMQVVYLKRVPEREELLR
jgi:hypothetical protein